MCTRSSIPRLRKKETHLLNYLWMRFILVPGEVYFPNQNQQLSSLTFDLLVSGVFKARTWSSAFSSQVPGQFPHVTNLRIVDFL